MRLAEAGNQKTRSSQEGNGQGRLQLMTICRISALVGRARQERKEWLL